MLTANRLATTTAAATVPPLTGIASGGTDVIVPFARRTGRSNVRLGSRLARHATDLAATGISAQASNDASVSSPVLCSALAEAPSVTLTNDVADSAGTASSSVGGIPKGFVVRDDGVYLVRNRAGITELERLASRIDVVAHARSSCGNVWDLVVRFVDRDGRVRQCQLSHNWFGSQVGKVWSRLLGMGAYVHASKAHRERLAEYLLSCEPIERGLMAAVGELAIELGLLAWPAGEAQRAAQLCFQDWVGRRGSVRPLEQDQSVALVRHHLQTCGDLNYRWMLSNDPARLPGFLAPERGEHYGYKRYNAEGQVEYLVFPETFNRVVCRGVDAQAVRRRLAAAGHIQLSGRETTSSVRVPQEGRTVRVIVLKSSLLDDGGQAAGGPI